MSLSWDSEGQQRVALAEAAVEGAWMESAAIATEPTESLRIRTEMMLCLCQHIEQQQWSLTEVCQVLGQPSPRMQNLLNGEIGRFSIEELIELLTQLGLTVTLSVGSTHLANPTKLVKNGPDETSLHH